MENFKELLSRLLMIAGYSWILLHLILIEIYGTVMIAEPSQYILHTEIILTSLIVMLGVERLLRRF